MVSVAAVLVAGVAGASPAPELRKVPHGSYWRYVPEHVASPPKVVVLLHGQATSPATILSQAQTLTEAWAMEADRTGAVLVTPIFDEENFGAGDVAWAGYRGLFGKEVGADKFIDECAADAVTVLPPRLLFYGHSAGAQTALRYVLKHPERVASVVATSCGSYAFPDAQTPWPLGMLGSDPAKWRRAAQLPISVIIGEKDEMPLPAPPPGKPTTRVGLARAWYDAMSALVPGQSGVKLILMADEPHSSGRLHQRAVAELLD